MNFKFLLCLALVWGGCLFASELETDGQIVPSKGTNFSEAKIVMRSNVQKINGVDASFDVFQDTLSKFTLRFVVSRLVRDYPSQVKVTVFSSLGTVIPNRFVTAISTSSDTNQIEAFYEVRLEPGIKLGYAVVNWKNEHRTFHFALVGENKRQLSPGRGQP